ncbi:MAG: TonB-dependent receptor [Rhodocyclaceae bacterium]|nr:TonB-dependent receptor [Rhodocyclaceae bacterium]
MSASKMARQISDSPSAVAIVTAEDIRAYGYRTLADVINGIRGLYTTFDRRYQYMGGRGFGGTDDYAGRIMLLIDGYATQDNLFNQVYLDESGLLDLELVERVEYVPGTGSATYGSNALLGIINVVTRQGRDFNGLQLSGEAASHGGWKRRVTYGKHFDNGAEVLLSASALDSDGQDLHFPAYDTPATNHGLAEGMDRERSRRLFGKLSQDGWTIEGAYADRRKGVPTNPSPLTAFNTPFKIQDENAFVSVRHEADLSLQLQSASSLFVGYYAYRNLRQYADYSEDNEKYGQRDFDGRWWSFDQKFVGTWFAGHTLVSGLELRRDFLQKFRWRYLSPTGEVLWRHDESFDRSTTSLYLTDELRLNDRWTLNLGARWDAADDLDANWSPRLALIYQPDAQTTWKASYSEAFKMPNAYDRSSYIGYGASAAPEYVAASELTMQHQFSAQLRFTGSVYNYRRSDQMVFREALDDYLAAGSSRTSGIELELEGAWNNGLRTRGSLAWQQARAVDGGQLANSPKVLGKLNLSVPLLAHGLRGGLEAQYVGPRQTLENRRLGAYALANLTLSSERKWYGLSASFSVRNLFDRDYEAVSPFDWRPDSGIRQDSLRMDGRTYWFQLNYDL